MIELQLEYKQKVLDALIEQRKNFSGNQASFARKWGVDETVFSRLVTGKKIDNLISPQKWLEIGHQLGVTLNQRKWKLARTVVYQTIEEDVLFCKEHSQSMMFVDECGIGKTFSAKYLSQTLKNCFYVDASQSKTKNQFIKQLAQVIGIEKKGKKYEDLKAEIKAWIRAMPNPIIIIDEAGDLEYKAFLDLKEFWNATEYICGWYLMGARGFKVKMNRELNNGKVGYDEIFSRFKENYTHVVPSCEQDKTAFFKALIRSVLELNMENKENIDAMLAKCFKKDDTGNIGGLRRAESLMILYK
jgi:hypothetical protein